MRWLIGTLLTGALALGLLPLAAVAQVQTPSEVSARPFDWPAETTFEFAIFDLQTNARIATAYYRVLKETIEGQTAYRFKYVGRNEQTSEASECWIYPETMLPMRSTRKLVSGGKTFFLDVAYSNGVIVIRRKYEGEDVQQQELPASAGLFDYEELIWLIPQLDFGGAPQARIDVFDTLNYMPTTVVINDLGEQTLDLLGKSYPAHAYEFDVSLTPYKYWTVRQDGRDVPARFDLGRNSFANLELDPKKVSTAKPAQQPPAAKQPVPEQQRQDTPKENDGEQAPPGGNPLGPPPPGGKY